MPNERRSKQVQWHFTQPFAIISPTDFSAGLFCIKPPTSSLNLAREEKRVIWSLPQLLELFFLNMCNGASKMQWYATENKLEVNGRIRFSNKKFEYTFNYIYINIWKEVSWLMVTAWWIWKCKKMLRTRDWLKSGVVSWIQWSAINE